MKLPGINYGGRAESLGRHDISLPAREAAAKSRVIGAVEGVAGQIYQDINEREMTRQQAEYNATMLSTEGDVNERINNGERVFGTQEMAYAGADMAQYGDQLEYQDYEAITPFYTSSMTQAHTAAMEKITSPGLRESIENDWKSHLVKGQMKAMHVQNTRHKEATLAQMNGELEIARAAGDTTLANTIVEEQLELNLISPEFARKEKRNTGIRVEEDGYIELLLNDDTDAIRKAKSRLELDDEAYSATGGVFIKDDRLEWKQRLDRRLGEIGAKRREQTIDLVKAYSKQQSLGFGDKRHRPSTSHISDDNRRDKLEKAMDTAEMMGREVRVFKNITPLEASNKLAHSLANMNSATPEQFERVAAIYETQLRAWANVQKERDADPARSAIDNSLAVKHKQGEYNNEKSSIARKELNLALKAEQMRVGIKPDQINYLTNDQVTGISTGLNQMNAQQKGATLSSMRMHQGDDWPVVYRQLARAGAISGIDAIAAGLDPRQHDVATALAAAQDSPDLKKRNAVEYPDIKDNDWKSMAQIALVDLQSSNPVTKSGTAAFENMLGAVDVLGRHYSLSRGLSPANGIALAKKNLIDDRWWFVSQNDGHSLRVPRGYEEHTITNGLSRIENYLEGVSFVVMETGVGPEFDQERAHEILKDSGYWETSGDGTRAILYWPTGEAVINVDEEVVEFTWEEIESDFQTHTASPSDIGFERAM